MLSMLEFRHLQTLTALREHGTLAAASEALHVTASALSHQLKELENYYDTLLVDRKTRPMTFTPAGLAALKLADTILPEVAKTKAAVRRIASGQLGRLRLASECHSCFDWLMPVLNQYRKHWPDVALDFATGFEPDPHQMLIDGDIDVLITASKLPLADIDYLPLFTYESRLALAPTHPLASKAAIHPSDLSGETLIAYPVDTERLDVMSGFLTPAGVKPKRIRSTEMTAMLIQLVASERGVAALPDWVVSDYERKGWVVSKSLGAGVRCQLYTAVRSADKSTAYVQGFLALLDGVKM